MSDPVKRSSESGEGGHRKKHHPSDHWRHYEVSGQFNACMSDPENEDNDTKEGDNSQNPEDKDQGGKICLDGDLRGDAHVNSKGLIVGQAEVHSKHNAIDVNFEMQANRKHKHKHKDEKSKGSRKPSPSSSESGQSEHGPGGPHAPKDPSNDQTSSESDDGIRNSKSNFPMNAHAGRGVQVPTPALTGTESGGSREASGEVSGGDTGGGESGETSASGDASAESNGSSNNSVNGNTNTPDESNSGDSKDESPLSGTDVKEAPKGNGAFDLVSTQVNQAPFIQKLYAMLEDTKLQHIIRWAPSFDRFYINPNEQFSQTLCLYFKHTNISSFVRQLSMYGFHKVSNSNHTRDKYFPWEFRHMDGLFKRGDLESLRSIKRRSTRQMNSKRVNYMAVLSGNEPTQVKHEPSPSYVPGSLPVASPAAQVLPHYPPDQQRGAAAYNNAGTSHHSPMPQRMIYPELNGNGNSAANGNAIVNPPQYNASNGMVNGNGHSAMNINSNGGYAPSSKESAVRLMRMHQAVQSQLSMVQETMSRLSENVNEMGVAIDQIVSQQQTAPQHSMHSGLQPDGAGKHAINDTNRMNMNALAIGGANGNHQPQHMSDPQPLRPSPHSQQPQHQQSASAPPPPPPPQQQYPQEDPQNRFQLRTLLN